MSFPFTEEYKKLYKRLEYQYLLEFCKNNTIVNYSKMLNFLGFNNVIFPSRALHAHTSGKIAVAGFPQFVDRATPLTE